MPKWLRALIAGYGAKKLGGGCFSTIIIFVVIYYALGQCNRPVSQGRARPATQIRTAPATAPKIGMIARESISCQPASVLK